MKKIPIRTLGMIFMLCLVFVIVMITVTDMNHFPTEVEQVPKVETTTTKITTIPTPTYTPPKKEDPITVVSTQYSCHASDKMLEKFDKNYITQFSKSSLKIAGKIVIFDDYKYDNSYMLESWYFKQNNEQVAYITYVPDTNEWAVCYYNGNTTEYYTNNKGEIDNFFNYKSRFIKT